MCRSHRGSHRGTTQRRQRRPTIDDSQCYVGGDMCDVDNHVTRCPASPDFIFRSDCRVKHLRALSKGLRNELINSSVGEKQQLYLLRKAEEKALKLAHRNRKLSVQHFKGHRRKTCRPGVGKSGSSSFYWLADEDLDIAVEHAYASVHERCQPVEFLAALDPPHDFTVWEEAIARAQLASRNSLPCNWLPNELQSLIRDLEKTENLFDTFRAKFLRRHGKRVVESLDLCTEGQSLIPAPLSASVSANFLSSCSKRGARITPGFHGTSGKFHESICSRGLLIPGQNNDIKVANGSAHGNGVYIAKLSNPWLSQGFARDVNKMFVCGVVDDALALDVSLADRLGSFSVTKQSASVRHVGDAMVVFEPVRVAPLFVAEWTSVRRKVAPNRPKKSKQPKKRGERVRTKRSRFKSVFWVREVARKWAWEAIKHKSGRWLKNNNSHYLPRWYHFLK